MYPMSNSNHFSLDMGITHADFFRLLPAAITPYDMLIKANMIKIFSAQRRVNISLGVEQIRRLSAHVSFPSTEVEFSFEQFSDAQREAFLHHFHLHFHRGCG
ncbi:MAG: hypothetical protein RL020_1468 [Pseudomonadota bacterium]|jgi:hypothetical protein